MEGEIELADAQAGVDTTPTAPAADPLLKKLYNSDRPPVELVPKVPLSPIINSCWLGKEVKAMLAETWIVPPAEAVEGGAPPPSFNAAAIDYIDLQKRVSKSAAFQKWNELMISIKTAENEVGNLKGAAQETKLNDIEMMKSQLMEVEMQVTDIKASFAEDPLSLVPWMQTLFELADAGMTTFEISGSFWPYCSLKSLFASENTSSYFDGVERILGVFKRRFERERGKNKIQVLLKIAPNVFQDGFQPSMLQVIVDKMRNTLYGDSPDAIDLLQLVWWDLKDVDFLPVLKVLQKLNEDRIEVGEDGNPVIVEAKRIKGLALVDFPESAVLQALQAGVSIVAVQIPHSVVDRSYVTTLEFCREYGIKVLSRAGLLGGLITEKYLGYPCPESIVGDKDLDDVPAALDTVNRLGGWSKLQRVLTELKAIADKHQVKIETVALRWQIDQGTFPLVSTRWAPNNWRQFGYMYWSEARPGVDPQLFAKESFLDAKDMQILNLLHLTTSQ